MPLRFQRKRPFYTKNAPQLALAIVLLLAALAVTVAWVAVSFRDERPENPAESSSPVSDPAAETYSDADTARLMLILTDHGRERFFLLTAEPVNARVRVSAVPGDTREPTETDKKGQTVTALLRQFGPARATRAAADALGLDIPHYIAMTGDQAESFLNYLEEGPVFTVPERVAFTDINGAVIRLKAGEHHLTATQTVGLLRYKQWSDPALYDRVGTALLTATLNAHWRTDRSLKADFVQISNGAATDLRIGDFTLWRPVAAYLARQNTDGVLAVAE